MLIIRKDQLEAFREAATRQFEQEMLIHLQAFSPPLFKAVGNEQMLSVIRLGIKRAQGYGFNLFGPVRLYLDLMLLFGSYFDSDPQYPWAAEILVRSNEENQMQQAEQLHVQTMDYRAKVSGPEDIYTLMALRKISEFARLNSAFPNDNLADYLRVELVKLYPQKALYIGPSASQLLINKALAGAQQQRFTSVRSVVLVTLLMSAFGHGCGIDPLYPWIGKTLNHPGIDNPDERATHLEKKAMIWLDHVLNYFA